MNLEHPAGLWWLLALGPLYALHAFRSSVPVAEVPHLRLWRSALAAAPVHWRPRWHLDRAFVLQATIVSLLSLGIASPSLPLGAPVEHRIIVLDTGASMLARTPGGPTRFEVAQQAALDELGHFPMDARVILIEAGAAPIVQVPATADRQVLVTALGRSKAVAQRSKPERAISLGLTRLRELNAPGKVLVFSDRVIQEPLPTNVQAFRIGEAVDNAGLIHLRAHARREGDSPELLVEVLVRIRNFGRQKTARRVVLRIAGSDVPLDVEPVALEPGRDAIMVLEFRASESERGTGIFVELDGQDALDVDDVAYAVIPPSPELDVLVSAEKDTTWFQRALSADPDVRLRFETDATASSARNGIDFYVYQGHCPSRPPAAPFVILGPPGSAKCLGLDVGAPVATPELTSWTRTDPRFRFVSLSNLRIHRASPLGPGGVRPLVESKAGILVGGVEVAGQTGTLLGFDPADSTWPQQTSFVLFTRNLIEQAREARASHMRGESRAGTPVALKVPASASEVRIVPPDAKPYSLPVTMGSVVLTDTSRAGHYFLAWKGQIPGSRRIALNLASPEDGDLRTPRTVHLEPAPPTRVAKGFRTNAESNGWLWALAFVLLLRRYGPRPGWPAVRAAQRSQGGPL